MEKVIVWILFVLFMIVYFWAASPVASESLGAW